MGPSVRVRNVQHLCFQLRLINQTTLTNSLLEITPDFIHPKKGHDKDYSQQTSVISKAVAFANYIFVKI
jgi:hypothetical protein